MLTVLCCWVWLGTGQGWTELDRVGPRWFKRVGKNNGWHCDGFWQPSQAATSVGSRVLSLSIQSNWGCGIAGIVESGLGCELGDGLVLVFVFVLGLGL